MSGSNLISFRSIEFLRSARTGRMRCGYIVRDPTISFHLSPKITL